MKLAIAHKVQAAGMLQLFTGVAAVAIVALGVRLAVDAYASHRNAERAMQVNVLVDELFEFGTDLALERGLATGRLIGDERSVRLAEQRRKVDAHWQRVQDLVRQVPDDIAETVTAAATVKRIDDHLARIVRQRDVMDQGATNTPIGAVFFRWISSTTGAIAEIGTLRDQLLLATGDVQVATPEHVLVKRQLWSLTEAIGQLRAFITFYTSAPGTAVPWIIEDLRQRATSIDGQLKALLALRNEGRTDEALRNPLTEFETAMQRIVPAAANEIEALAAGRIELGSGRWFDLATEATEAARSAAAVQSSVTRRALERSTSRLRTRLLLFLGFAIGAMVLAWRSLNRVRLLANDLFVQKELAETTLQSIGDAVIATDAKGVVEYLNPVAEHLTGWTLAEARGKPFSDVFQIVNHTHASHADPVGTCLRQGIVVGLSSGHFLIRRDGSELRIEDSAAPIRDRDNRIAGAVVVFFSVDQQPKDHLLVYQATRDALTGLINRREFERRLTDLVERAKLHNEHHVLGYIDLDQFKIVNDTCGHAAGDDMLRQIVFLLRKRVRGSDVLGRLGGDEIGLLLHNCEVDQARELADTLRTAIKEFRFRIQGRIFESGLSIGLVPVTAESASSDELLSLADAACYMAKEKGRNRVHVYDISDLEMARHHGDMQWVPRLGDALREDQFVLYGQRIRPLAPGLPEHIEVLIRLRNADGTLAPPMTFIPAAERYGLIGDIDRWVIRNTFARIAKLDPAARPLVFNINLSGNSIGDRTLIDMVREQAALHGVAPGSVCFEITETAAIRDLEGATALMEALGKDGYAFALDDFGSGLSSFSYLKSLPVQTIKIDGAFVRRLSEDSLDYVMVQSAVSIGRLLKMRTVAEFVESEPTLNILRRLGVDYVQGFHVDNPCPLEQQVNRDPAP